MSPSRATSTGRARPSPRPSALRHLKQLKHRGFLRHKSRNPYAPNWYWNILGRCYHTAQRYEEAITAFERIDTPQHFNHAYMAACHQALGHTDEAKKHVQNTLTINPKFKISEFANQLPYRSAEDLTMFLDGLRITGLPE